jgi:hypothetical protein
VAIERSYCRIVWQNRILKLHMVNPDSKQFTIFAEPLINIMKNPGHFVRVKRKDNDPDKGQGYYRGEIYGSAEDEEDGGEEYTLLTLYMGPAGKVMRFEEVEGGSQILDAIEEQRYHFPRAEFARFVGCVDSMYAQETHFSMLKMGTDIHFPGEGNLL